MIIHFNEAYKIHKRIVERVKKELQEIPDFSLERSNFSLHFNYRKSTRFDMENNFILTLDYEDVEYFANKYLPKLKEELDEEINKLKAKYELE